MSASDGEAAPASSAFYRVDLFDLGEPIEVQFFEAHELQAAKQWALAAAANGTARRAEVRDDADKLLLEAPAPAKQTGGGGPRARSRASRRRHRRYPWNGS